MTLKKEEDIRLSYSSSQLVINCEQRYYHYKIAKTPHDQDYVEDYEAFNIGLAFHQVLEKNKHTSENLATLIPLACNNFKIPEKTPLIHAMILAYLKSHKRSGLQCIATEFKLVDDIFIGFIDALMVDVKGGWWIKDLKTAARSDIFLWPKLLSDPQLNLYAGYAPMIAKMFNLDPDKFMGARYHVTTKSILKRKKGESYKDYVARMIEGIESRDIIVPKEMMRPHELADWHTTLFQKTLELRDGRKPLKNYSYCFSYFRPCPYFSNCHGMTVSESYKAFEC